MIHSHNDYWRDVPLYTALANGVHSIEADVWLNPKDQKLYVGHNYISLTRARSFMHLYVDQLVKILEDTNVRDEEYDFFNETDYVSPENIVESRRPWEPFFDEAPSTIQLVVDLKTRGDFTYYALFKELEPLRERGWLTRWDGTKLVQGPVTVVMTGNGFNHDVRAIVPTREVVDLFMDAPLLSLDETWTGVDGKTYGWNATTNAPMASAGYSSVTSWTGREPISSEEMAALKAVFSHAQAPPIHQYLNTVGMHTSILSLTALAIATSSVGASPLLPRQAAAPVANATAMPAANATSTPAYTLFTLPYGTAGLVPYISNQTNVLHLGLLAGAAAGLNTIGAALAAELSTPAYSDLTKLYSYAQTLSTVTGALQTHELYFAGLCPPAMGGGNFSMASPSFAAQVTMDFGGYEGMITALNTETLSVPGSGWGWLVWDTKTDSLDTTYTIDDDLLDPTLLPILNIDIWEHAFFLDTGNNHTEYLANLEHIYNWSFASAAFANITSTSFAPASANATMPAPAPMATNTTSTNTTMTNTTMSMA
ncbi:hypothetical protein RQP46_000086 [Phenoliferia psychrophenolica]